MAISQLILEIPSNVETYQQYGEHTRVDRWSKASLSYSISRRRGETYKKNHDKSIITNKSNEREKKKRNKQNYIINYNT